MRSKYLKETYRNRDAWLSNRGLGGSAASSILGLNPYMSILELYRAIVMPNENPIHDENESMRYGTQCEPLIRKIFALDHASTYRTIAPKGFEMYRRADKTWMTATLDGKLIRLADGKKGILEIKTHDVRKKDDAANWENRIPDNYYVQVLHYLLVKSDADFAVLNAKLRFFDYSKEKGLTLNRTEIREYYVDRSDEQVQKDMAYLEQRETEFWEENVLKKRMPIMQIKF